MEGFRFSLRDLPQRDILDKFSKRFPNLNKESVESCIALLRTASDISKLFESNFAKHGLSEGRFTILMLLYRQDNHLLSPASLSQKAEVTRATMTGLISGLETQGFIEKVPNPNDQRGYLVHLCQKGLDLLNEILPNHYMLNASIMSGLEQSQLNELMSLLNALRLNLPNTIQGE
ncbi:transcriptional regulator [Desulfosporosinus acidiphilus SJ4]|uniref:Transcriptional regulator n=1 Tax=Desulfosporosinus acidiphilus (strain DSM 22704 / JCM 16185 / SJ4) TaxID=646529 RepID=I4D2L8_DESAJ|nr:MarR family transcriptional regulator [Desulfosporosinus acidiphilus]AFM40042.1 transcriptional regulator [Desulfosporosinus acidiphilus SJ4]